MAGGERHHSHQGVVRRHIRHKPCTDNSRGLLNKLAYFSSSRRIFFIVSYQEEGSVGHLQLHPLECVYKLRDSLSTR